MSFTARARMFRAGLEGSVRITGSAQGTTLEILIETAPPPENSGMLDGVRNQKSADKLAAHIAASLGARA